MLINMVRLVVYMIAVKTAIFVLLFLLSGAVMPRPGFAASSPQDWELIVFFKEGQSPEDLYRKIEQRKKEVSDSSWNQTKFAWQDFTRRLAKKDPPEKQMTRLLQADDLAGVVSKVQMFPYDVESKDAYLVQLNGSHTVEYATTLFNTLPEVEYAEPSMLFEDLD